MSEQTKVALVTGASRGIGRAIATALAGEGYCVAGTATTADGAQRISDYLGELGNGGRGFALDVCDGGSVQQVLGEVKESLGAPLVVVNNAGITRDNIMLRMKEDEWDAVINTNLSSLYRVSKACIKDMTRARTGRIINIGSVVGAMGNAGQANYAAAKAGLEGFTRSLARELGARNITVNAVAPGFIATDMTDALAEKQREELISRIPLQRLGQPEEVAAAVCWLASDAAAYVTGTTLHVNGGMHM